MTQRPLPEMFTSRRTLAGLAAAGVGVPLLAACGDDGGTATDTGSSGTPSSASSSAAPTGSATAGGGEVAEGLTSTADIEVGGGAIFADEKVVITQPTEGEFKCFSAVCTHQGCLLSSVSDGTMNCDCHGSTFNLETGDPESGPASAPLEEVAISVAGDQISLA